ncbi:hypothetical protein HF283_10770, partial [Acidithiobacillus ferrooxidans]|nr:hypothetical protein [Acidithiobacillus ferrooxidans]
RNEWNIARTAEVVGLERTHLYRKLKNLSIALKGERRAGEDGDEGEG